MLDDFAAERDPKRQSETDQSQEIFARSRSGLRTKFHRVDDCFNAHNEIYAGCEVLAN